MFYADVPKEPNTEKVIGYWKFSIQRPGEVTVRDTNLNHSAVFFYDEDGRFVPKDLRISQTVYAKPGTAKRDKEQAAYDSAMSKWSAALELIVGDAENMLFDPEYLSRCEEIRNWVSSDISRQAAGIVKGVEIFKKNIADGWFDPTSSSTGSAANREKELAILIAQLAAVVEVYDNLFRPYVRAKYFAEQLLHEANLGMRISLHTYH